MLRIILLTSFLLIGCSDRLKSIEGGWVVPGGYGFEGSAFYFSNNHFMHWFYTDEVNLEYFKLASMSKPTSSKMNLFFSVPFLEGTYRLEKDKIFLQFGEEVEHFNILKKKKIIDIFEIDEELYLSDLSKKEWIILRYHSYLDFEGYLLLKHLILYVICLFQNDDYAFPQYHYDENFDLNDPFNYQKKYKSE